MLCVQWKGCKINNIWKTKAKKHCRFQSKWLDPAKETYTARPPKIDQKHPKTVLKTRFLGEFGEMPDEIRSTFRKNGFPKMVKHPK